jgi:hypothetical protein
MRTFSVVIGRLISSGSGSISIVASAFAPLRRGRPLASGGLVLGFQPEPNGCLQGINDLRD